MQFTRLRHFLAVVDAGSIRGAARTLRISQPALTRSIRLLETELQAVLLERTSRGVVPTPAGRAFFVRSRLIHHELGRARDELAELAGKGAGSIAFGVSPQAAVHIVPPALAQFRETYPTTEVRIVDGLSHRLLPMLRDGTLDFVIGPRPQGDIENSIASHALFTNRFVVAARRGHPLRKAKSLRELVDAHWVVLSPTGFAESIIPQAFEKNGLPSPKSVVKSDSYVAMLALVARGDMIGALTHRLFEERLVRDYFEALELKERLPEFALYLFRRRDSQPTAAAGAMVEAVQRVAKRLIASRPGR